MRRKRQQGAVMVEALIVLSMLILMFALIIFVHDVASADIQAAQNARMQAWQRAMQGCSEDGFAFRSMLEGLKEGELPIPDSFIPSHTAEGASSATVRGVFGKHVRRVSHVLKIPCASKHTASEGDVSGDWLMNLTN